jgi:deoxyribonuclease IV
MLSNGRRIGAHLPLGGGMVKAADRAVGIGASAMQVFCDNPTSWSRRPALPRELPAFRDRLTTHDIAPLAIHAPYLVNLAGPPGDTSRRSVDVLANEVRVAGAYGAACVNVHVGSHRGTGPEAGITRLADGLAAVMELTAADAPDVTVVLENGAGGGFGLGSTVEELAAIDAAVVASGVARDRFAFCIDTAHAWGAGYPIDTAPGVDDLVRRLDGELGMDRIRMVHLNDSRSAMGSQTDRHEHIGAGRIGAAGLRRMLTHPALEQVTYILETPGMEDGWDAVNLARVKALAEGRDLEPLPPAAFATRSAKGRSAPAEDETAEDETAEDETAASGAPALVQP